MLLRFSIRDLLWLTLVVGLATGWFLEHRKWVMVDPLLVDVEEPVLQIYRVNVPAEFVLKTLQSSLVGKPDVQLTADFRRNEVLVKARPNQQIAISRLILKLEREQ